MAQSERLLRVGIGYDIHRLGSGRRLFLGGVEIPYERGLEGHSDADVVLHAIADAILGAAALGDIGQHFPPRDPRYKDISSLWLLARVGDKLEGSGYKLINIDATVVAEEPMLLPYIPLMKERTAKALQIAPSQVSIKATTNEGMGALGQGEGIAVWAIALIQENT